MKTIARVTMAQSNMMLAMFSEQATTGSLGNRTNQVSNPPTTTSKSVSRRDKGSLDVEMKNGSLMTKSEIIRSLKKLMTVEILKVPWLSLLHSEFGKVVERK